MIDKHTGAITNGGIFSLYKQAPCWRIKSVGDCWRVTGLGEPSPQVKSAAEAKIRRTQSSGSAAMWIDPSLWRLQRLFSYSFSFLKSRWMLFYVIGKRLKPRSNMREKGRFCISQHYLISFDTCLIIVWKADFVIIIDATIIIIAIECVCVCVWLVCWWFSNVKNYFSFFQNRCRLHRKPISWSTLFYLHHPRIPAGKNNYFFPPLFSFLFFYLHALNKLNG